MYMCVKCWWVVYVYLFYDVEMKLFKEIDDVVKGPYLRSPEKIRSMWTMGDG